MKKQWIALLLALVLALAPCCMAQAEEDKIYAVGDVLEDFTATLVDGTEVTLSGLLAEKKVVMLNFWATWCGPCRSEFPFMEEAYNQVSDDVAIVALSVDSDDTDDVIVEFMEEVGLTTLPMGQDTKGFNDEFGVQYIPTSVIVDRNGVICWMDSGSITSTQTFLNLFNVYTDPEYTEPVLLEGDIPGGKPTVAPATSEELSAALNVEGGELVFSHEGNAFTWPFVVAEEGVVASNVGAASSTARMDVTVTAEAGQALAYEYKALCNEGTDSLEVLVNEEGKVVYSGEVADWTSGCVTFPEAGEYTVSFRYEKSVNSQPLEGEFFGLRNVRLTSEEEAKAALPELPHALEGTELGYELVSTDAVKIEGAFIGNWNGVRRTIVAEGETLELRVLIGADVDPYTAAVYDDDGNVHMLNNLPCDETGYLITMEMPEDPDAYLTVELYENVFDEDSDYTRFRVHKSVEAFCAYMADLSDSLAGSGYDVFGKWYYSDNAPGNQSAQYGLVVKDAEGNPVQGVLVQFHDAASYVVVNTDETGTASFEWNPYAYEVSVLKVPEGFNPVEDVFTLDAEGELLEITLTKAE